MILIAIVTTTVRPPSHWHSDSDSGSAARPEAIWILDGHYVGYLLDIGTPDIGIFPISGTTVTY